MRWAFILLAISILSTGTARSEATPCALAWMNSDPAGDITIMGVPGAPQSALHPPGVDLTGVVMTLDNGTVQFNFTLVEPPEFGSTMFSYRYWLGFLVKPEGQSSEYMGLRIAQTTTYDSGHLVSSNEKGNQGIAELPVKWVGNEASFSFPLSLVQALYDRPIEIGGAQSQSDGRSLGPQGQGFIFGAIFVDYTVETAFDGDCLPRAVEVNTANESSSQGRSLPAFTALAGLSVLALALARNRGNLQ